MQRVPHSSRAPHPKRRAFCGWGPHRARNRGPQTARFWLAGVIERDGVEAFRVGTNSLMEIPMSHKNVSRSEPSKMNKPSKTLPLGTAMMALAILISSASPAYSQQEVSPTWFDPWAEPSAAASQVSQPPAANPARKVSSVSSHHRQQRPVAQRPHASGSRPGANSNGTPATGGGNSTLRNAIGTTAGPSE